MDASRVAVVIEDDADIRQVIVTLLRAAGLEVHSAVNGLDGLAAVREHNPDVVTLDLGLPDLDGVDVAHRIRTFSDTYIIMLTARAKEVDTLRGLASGADDYVTKPFRPKELRARVESLLRRPRGGVAAPFAVASEPVPNLSPERFPAPIPGRTTAPLAPALPSPPLSVTQAAVTHERVTQGRVTRERPAQETTAADSPAEHAATLEHNGLRLEARTRTARVQAREVPLTRTEFDLLHALMQGGRTVRTTAALVRWLRTQDYDTGRYISESEERAVQVHIANLRKKLGDSPQAPTWVETVRGVGYRMTRRSPVAP